METTKENKDVSYNAFVNGFINYAFIENDENKRIYDFHR